MASPLAKCRVCWEEKPKSILVSVTKTWATESDRTIKDILLFCVPSLSIQDNTQICPSCMWQLKFTFQFISRCHETEKILLEETSQFIEKLTLSENTPVKLEKILEQSIEEGKTIQIIFENPVVKDVSETKTNEVTVKESRSSNVIKQEKENEHNEDDDWFNNEVADDTDDNADQEQGHSSKAPKKKYNATTENENEFEYTLPQEMVEMLEFAPNSVQCLVVEANISEEHQQSFLEEGINILDMSTQVPDKKKRTIYLSRDLEYGSYSCAPCKLSFAIKNNYADHRYLHTKGRISIPGEPVYSCQLCSGVFMSDKHYREHCRAFHNISCPHECSKCGKKFRTIGELKGHMDEYKDSDRCVVQCKRCSKEFSNKKDLERHEANVADAPCCDYFQCKICSLKFTKNDYKEHCMRVHTKYKCPQCDKPFYNNTGLKTHMKNVHIKEYNICHECGKHIKNRRMLQHHMDTVHGDNTYICDKCPREFKSQVYLRKHARNCHSGPRQRLFTCEKCGRSFYDQTRLTQHIRLLHMPPGNLKCPTCGEGFVRRDYLDRHLAFHDKYMQFSCGICKQSFSSESRLASHQYMGHDENGRPALDYSKRVLEKFRGGTEVHRLPNGKVKKIYASEKPVICNICNKVLANSSNIKMHYKAHLKIREFRCEICQITLQSHVSYKKHMKRHEDPNFEFSCNICYACKSSGEELRVHMEQTHKNLKYQCKYCPAKFGRKHLMYSHESIKHEDEYEKKKKVFEILTSKTVVAPENTVIPRTNKGRKLGYIDQMDNEVDQLIKIMDPDEEDSENLNNGEVDSEHVIVESNFDILSEEYQMSEEDRACRTIIYDTNNAM